MSRLFPALVFSFILAAMPALAAGPARTAVKGKSVASAAQPIGAKIQGQMSRIQKALKSGKITPAQSKTLKEGLHAIQKKEADFIKQNGKGPLTADQQGQLDQMLFNNEKNLPDDPIGKKNANKMPDDPFKTKGANIK